MITETQPINPLSRSWRWLMKMGLAVPLIGGAVLALLAVITWISPRYEAPQEVDVGVKSDYAIGLPKFYEAERFWVSHLPSGEIIALYDRDPITGCTVPWDKNYEFMGATGWFRDACSKSTYDLAGNCFNGQCQIGLNRLDVRENDEGHIIVDMRTGTAGTPRKDNGDPVTPP